jgi:hypothetical protein
MDIEAISGGGFPFICHFKYRKAEGLSRNYFHYVLELED